MNALRALLLLVLAAVPVRAAAQQGGNHPADRPYAASCATCHKAVVKEFADNPHNPAAPVNRGEADKCESCHGPGAAHAKSGDVSAIFDFASAKPTQVDEKCQSCHGGSHLNVDQSVHGKAGVSCLACHSIHSAGVPRHLIKAQQPQLCLQCHADVKSQFSMAFHHKVQERLIDCTDCHDAHAALGEGASPSSTRQFKVCTKCHMGVAGPFAFEHAPVRAEGCTACHFAHGGPNPGLLIQANVNTICRQCHFPSTNSRTGSRTISAHIESAHSQPCTSCHASIHGSNTSAVFVDSPPANTRP